jgi:acetylornithine deacetylase/succinyl-diaminopimelate desuccinylase-like protein
MLSALAKARGGLAPLGVRLLARPALHDYLLESFVPDPYVRRSLGAILRNTATPTVLKAGEITNVIPSVAEAHLDGRTLPGQTTQDLLREIQEVVDDEQITFELLQELPPVEAPIDSPLYEQLSRSIKAMDPQGEAMPFVTAGATDASIFCKLGMRFYGFEPVVLPERPKVAFGELFHARDERIPVDGFKKGLHALWNAVVGFCGQR